MMKINEDKKFIICVFAFLVVALLLIFFDTKTTKYVNNIISTNKTTSYEENKNGNINKFTLTREERVYKYITTIFGYINNKEYEKAYNLLIDDYRNNHFPTLDDFKNYVDIYYPDKYTPKYDSFSRLDGNFVVKCDLRKQEYTKEDLIKGYFTRYEYIVIQESMEMNYKFSFNGFVSSHELDRNTTSIGKIEIIPLRIDRYIDKNCIYVAISNKSFTDTLEFSSLDVGVLLGNKQLATNKLESYRIRPLTTDTIKVLYNLRDDKTVNEDEFIINSVKVEGEKVIIRAPFEFAK